MSVPAPLSRRSPGRRAALKRRLERLSRDLDRRYLSTDPIVLAHGYPDPADREIAAFVASTLAFGNVRAIQASARRALAVLGERPAGEVESFCGAPAGAAVGRLAGVTHRWIRPADLAALFATLGEMRRRSGSIGGFFLEGHRPGDEDIGPSLASFSERARALAARPRRGGADGRVTWFFSSPRDGSACKRLCLFLRWMVRGGDGIDLGLWPGVPRRQLVLPLDTHLVRLSRALGLTRRRTPGWAMALEATRSLALLDPEDPVRFDFSLSRLGILDLCLHGRDPLDCRRCPPPRLRSIGAAARPRPAAAAPARRRAV